VTAAPIFDTPLPESAGMNLTFRAYDRDSDLLVAGNASILYVLKSDGSFVGQIALAGGPMAQPVIAGGRVFVLTGSHVIAYQLAPFSVAPVAQSAVVFRYSPLVGDFRAAMAAVPASDGQTRIYGAVFGIAGLTTVAVFDASLNTLASAHVQSMDATSLAIAADPSGHPYVGYLSSAPRPRIGLLDGVTLGAVRNAQVFREGLQAAWLARVDQPWTYGVPDGAPYLADRIVSRADDAAALRLAFATSDAYRCAIDLRVFASAPGSNPQSLPAFRQKLLRFQRPGLSLMVSRLTIPVDPQTRTRAACAPYMVARSGGLTAFLFLSRTQPAGVSCQGWIMPALAYGGSDWISYWDAEWNASSRGQALGTYVETIGDDDWKLYRLVSERLGSGEALYEPPGPIWSTI